MASEADDPRSRAHPEPVNQRGNHTGGGCGEPDWGTVFTIHATKKLLDRVNQPVQPSVEEPSTALGNWYATAMFWKPQVALLVNERSLLPVFMALAPAATLLDRFPEQFGMVLEGLGVPTGFVVEEVAAMAAGSYAKTANRSVIGSMNDFAFLAGVHRAHGDTENLVALAVRLAGTPCGPLRKGHGYPDREVEALVVDWQGQ